MGERRLLRAFRGAGPFKPNLREAEELTGVRVRSAEDLDLLAHKLREARDRVTWSSRAAETRWRFEKWGP